MHCIKQNSFWIEMCNVLYEMSDFFRNLSYSILTKDLIVVICTNLSRFYIALLPLKTWHNLHNIYTLSKHYIYYVDATDILLTYYTGAPGLPRVLAGDCSTYSYSYDLVWAVNSAYSPIVHEVQYITVK